MADLPRLTVEQVQPSLEQWLEVEFSFLHVETLATSLAVLPRDEQDFLLNWMRRIAGYIAPRSFARSWPGT